MSAEIDKMMYSFVMEDVLKGVAIYVPPGYVAAVYDLGRGVLKRVYTPGLHLKIPFWQKAKLFNVQTLEYTIDDDFNSEMVRALGDKSVEATTKENEIISIQGTVLMRLDVHQIPVIWQTIGEEFVQKIVRPTIRSRFRLIASRFTYEEMNFTKRDMIEVEIKNELERIFFPRGIFVENVLLGKIERL
jgi:regulator of protease activity HflC (stomatin/prohibitin superfamily)